MNTNLILLTRDAFREGVFERDHHRCVICGAPARDAHHIIERRLFSDGGYYLDNGASLCADHHIEAERTTLGAQEIREAAGIERIILPDHLYEEYEYDKWGNIIMPNGTRIMGELFHDESVQKILAEGGVLGLFSLYIKHPRTYHLPWSDSMTSDDRKLDDVSAFEGRQVVVSVKMDGEQCSMYHDHIHARSLETESHPSRTWVRNLHAAIAHLIPEGWRVCGENLYARHSIAYGHLPSYFLVHSIWNDRNYCLSWSETCLWAALLDLSTVPTLYEGVWDETLVRGLYRPSYNGDECEGYVVRIAEEFHYAQFRQAVAKYVRADHNRMVVHNWKAQQVIPNVVDQQ